MPEIFLNRVFFFRFSKSVLLKSSRPHVEMLPMIKPPKPLNENKRLECLLALEVLDTEADDNLNELVEIAARVCETPIALISLVDENRQWFKAKIGITVSETSRDISFCGHAINSSELFVVSDPTNDPRFHDNPLVTGDLHLRFYAGAPLVTSEGPAVGTLCVIDQREKNLTPEQEKFLCFLSKQVVTQLEMKKNFRDLQALSRKVLEQQDMLREQDKFTVIGKLASSVSHELNNPLAIIGGSVHILRELVKNGESSDKIILHLDRIDSTVRRVGKVGSVLRSLSTLDLKAYKDVDSLQAAFAHLLENAKKVE